MANAAQGKKGKRLSPKDFLPKWDQPARDQGAADHLDLVRQLNKAMGGTDNTGR